MEKAGRRRAAVLQHFQILTIPPGPLLNRPRRALARWPGLSGVPATLGSRPKLTHSTESKFSVAQHYARAIGAEINAMTLAPALHNGPYAHRLASRA